jgi:hypothetical protein
LTHQVPETKTEAERKMQTIKKTHQAGQGRISLTVKLMGP